MSSDEKPPTRARRAKPSPVHSPPSSLPRAARSRRVKALAVETARVAAASEGALEAAAGASALVVANPTLPATRRTAPAALAAPAWLPGGRALEGFAMARDGTPLYYEVAGPPVAPASGSHGVPVVLCDGIGCDGYVWKYLTPELARDRLTMHFHYRGHGKTPIPRDSACITVADCADDVMDVVTAAASNVQIATRSPIPPNVDRVFLAGHSMGVQVCLEAFRRHRDRVAGLILLCGSYGTPLRTFKGSRLLEDLLPAIRLAVHAVPRAVSTFWRNVLPTELAFRVATSLEINGALIRREDFLPYLHHMANVDPRLFVDMLSAMGRHTAREILSEVDVPTLIVAGDRDGFTPLSLSEEMHRLIPGSELLVVHSGSHTAPIEKREEVTGAVADFLRRHDG